MNFQNFNQFALTNEQAISVQGGTKPVSLPNVTLPANAVAVLPVIDETLLCLPSPNVEIIISSEPKS